MVILADSDGRKAIEVFCDIALKVGGLRNLQFVTEVFSHVQGLEQLNLPPKSLPSGALPVETTPLLPIRPTLLTPEQTEPEGEG